MVALDRPYVNLWFHTECFASIGDYNKMKEFLKKYKKFWNKNV